MKPSFRKAGNPASHTSTLAALLLSATALAGCATTQKPPEISYDDAAPAVQTADPDPTLGIFYDSKTSEVTRLVAFGINTKPAANTKSRRGK